MRVGAPTRRALRSACVARLLGFSALCALVLPRAVWGVRLRPVPALIFWGGRFQALWAALFVHSACVARSTHVEFSWSGRCPLAHLLKLPLHRFPGGLDRRPHFPARWTDYMRATRGGRRRPEERARAGLGKAGGTNAAFIGLQAGAPPKLLPP